MGGIRTAAQYQAQLRALLPSGPAWDPERVPELEEVLQGVAVELARLDARAADLLNEMDPAGVSELVPDWEQVMNLPDPCLGATPLFDDRRLAVRRRLLAVGSQAVGYYLDIAKSQGYPNATITELEAPRMGRCAFRLGALGHVGSAVHVDAQHRRPLAARPAFRRELLGRAFRRQPGLGAGMPDPPQCTGAYQGAHQL